MWKVTDCMYSEVLEVKTTFGLVFHSEDNLCRLLLEVESLKWLALTLNPLQEFIFVEVEFLATLVGGDKPLACECIDSRFRLACDYARLVNLDNAVLVDCGLRLQCHHHFVDSFHLLCQITYRLRQFIKCDNFICHMRTVFNVSVAKEIGVIMVKLPTKI